MMDRQLTYEDILCAKAAEFFDGKILYVVEKNDEVYGFSKGSSQWHHKENYWDYLDSELMLPYFAPLSNEEAAQLYLSWTKDPRADSCRLDAAITYAVEHHAGQLRKGTVRPYILHPMETMQILHTMKADNNLLIAGVLHDTIEDTTATEEEIRRLFGDDVADLVTAHSEDKSKTWLERKTHAIQELAKSNKRLKMLVMADKVSNLRSMVSDYQQVGDFLWNRFNASPEQQTWYYGGVQEALKELQNEPECSAVYWEMVEHYNYLFISFCFNPARNMFYQICRDGTQYRLENHTHKWRKTSAKIPDTVLRFEHLNSRKATRDSRASFVSRYEMDLANASYDVYASDRRHVSFNMYEGELSLSCHDFGPECVAMTGTDEYEFYYSLDERATRSFWSCLRAGYGMDKEFKELLISLFGSDDGPSRFTVFCEKNGIKPSFTAI